MYQNINNNKYTFSGHESFQCRQHWLKKGFDFVQAGKTFRTEDAVVTLGVGKNMVSAIRYWLRAFGLIDSDENLNEFAKIIFDNETGCDPYLEDEATLWLLHYHLIKTKLASTYSLIFNEFRRERIEFICENYLSFIKRKSELEPGMNFNTNTISADFEVFKKMYYTESSLKSSDDSYSGLFTDLGLLERFVKSDNINESHKGKKEFFFIENTERKSIPIEVFLYTIVDNDKYGTSISLNTLEQDYDSPGSIFAINHFGIIEKINEAVDSYDYLTFTDHAGIKELQFKDKPSPFEVLKSYYEK